MNDDNIKIDHGELETAELRELIRSAYPAHIYTGAITSRDDNLEHPELDEEKQLHENLKGKAWTDLSQPFLDSQPDGYVLLVETAFVSFFPAWLMRSLDNLNKTNKVRDFVLYAFSPKRDLDPDTTMFIQQRLLALNSKQRNILRIVLMKFTETDLSAFQKKLALEASRVIERLP